jgi:acyl-activating enzyme 14
MSFEVGRETGASGGDPNHDPNHDPYPCPNLLEAFSQSIIHLLMFHASLSIASLRSDGTLLRCFHEGCLKSSREFVSQIAHLSHAFSSRIKPGSRIILIGKTSASFVECLLAAMDSGGIAVPINTRWSQKEVAQALSLVQPSLIIADKAHYLLMASVCGPCPLLHMEEEVLLGSRGQMESPASCSPPLALQLKSPSNGAGLIIFTSGTSAAPKAVLLSHANLHSQSLAKLSQPPSVGFCYQDVYLHLAPLFHIGGISSLLASLMAGARQVLIPSFDPSLALGLIREEKVTCFITVPTIVQDLIAAAGSRKLEGIAKILVGAGGVNDWTREAIARIFPNARLCSAYGMSEACSSITCDEITSIQHPQPAYMTGGSCVGRPAPGIEVKIDQLDGEIGCEFKYGEVLTRGPHVMLGYYNDPEATSKAVSESGWLRTGDLGYVDEQGLLWLLGRAKDVLKSGGENVFASEVEEALMLCPGIVRAAVVGLADERLGEKVAALVVLESSVQWEGPVIPSPSLSSVQWEGPVIPSPSLQQQDQDQDQVHITLTPRRLQVRNACLI